MPASFDPAGTAPSPLFAFAPGQLLKGPQRAHGSLPAANEARWRNRFSSFPSAHATSPSPPSAPTSIALLLPLRPSLRSRLPDPPATALHSPSRIFAPYPLELLAFDEVRLRAVLIDAGRVDLIVSETWCAEESSRAGMMRFSVSFLRRFVGVVRPLPLPLTTQDESEPVASPLTLLTLGVGEFGGSASAPLDWRDVDGARMVEAFDDDLVILLEAPSLPRSSSSSKFTAPVVASASAAASVGEAGSSSSSASTPANGPLGSSVELR